MTLRIQLLSQVRARSLARTHAPAPSPERYQRSTKADLSSPFNSSFVSTSHAPAPPNLDRSPTTSPRVLKPRAFLSYFSVLLTDVDRWDGPSDDTDARFRFGVCSIEVGSRWRGRWIGRGSRRSESTANIVENVWTNLQWARAKECECGAGIIRNPTHSLAFSLHWLLQDPMVCSRPLNDARDLMCS